MTKQACIPLYPKRHYILTYQALYFIAGLACGYWAINGGEPAWTRIIVLAALSLILWHTAKHKHNGILIGEQGITILQTKREIIWEDIAAVRTDKDARRPAILLDLHAQGGRKPEQIRIETRLLPLDGKDLRQLIENISNAPPQARGEIISRYPDMAGR
ncbi:MAG: hypothetical protein Q3966_02705 [Neisseria sp.]|nr:hypothetical protein [Neisseria sp.]